MMMMMMMMMMMITVKEDKGLKDSRDSGKSGDKSK